MKLQQLRYIWEVAHHDLNVSATAQSLFTSQPGISKQIRLLEDELGVEVFARSGKHLTRVTPAGEVIIAMAGDILREVGSIKQVAQEFSNERRGTLSIATTHTQARYVLPEIFKQFKREYPDVNLNMNQGTTEQIAELASAAAVDFAIAPEVMDRFPELIMLPCYTWNRCVVVPMDHPLAGKTSLTFEDVAEQPVVTYASGFRERLPLTGVRTLGRSSLDETFVEGGHSLDIVFTAADTDVIKTYVRLGFGIGIIASMAYDEQTDSDLVAIDASNLFRPSTTYIGCRKGTFLRKFMIDFINFFAPHLSHDLIREAFATTNNAARDALFADVELPAK